MSKKIQKVDAGQSWKEKCCDHVVTVTEVDDEFATCTMVAFESDSCYSSSPLHMFLDEFDLITVNKRDFLDRFYKAVSA